MGSIATHLLEAERRLATRNAILKAFDRTEDQYKP
jgi:hypothetical protein